MNTVEVDTSSTPSRLRFSRRFNAAVPFIERHVAQGRGARLAIRTTQADITYSQLAATVERCAAGLMRLGLRPGERLLMVVKDCPAFFYVFWGAIKAGIIPVPLNTLLRHETYAFMIDDAGAAGIVHSAEYAAEIQAALAGCRNVPAHVLRTEGEEPSLDCLIAQSEPPFAAAPTTAEDDCFWLYSSGSTGRPKGAVHRHRDMIVTSQLLGVDVLGMTLDDVCFSEAKLFFAYGLGNAMSFPLWVGATTVLNDQRPGPATSLPIIKRFRPTLYFSVPTLYAAYLEAFDKERPDFSSVRRCISAGEALPPEILRRWHERTGLQILDGIGSTEALHIFISNIPGDVKPGSTGRVVPGYRARIVDDHGEEVPDGKDGRLFVTGESIARCYWNDPERTARTMVGEWLNTGDTYRRDALGYFYYCGRTDDMLKVGGVWCSPFEIESKLVEHPLVLEAAVVGRADADGLIKPEAFVVLQNSRVGDDDLAADLLKLCKRQLAPYKYPRWIHFVPQLPKTATGKIQRFMLRAGGAGGSAPRPSHADAGPGA